LTDEEDGMRGPTPPPVVLVAAARGALDALVRRHGTPQQLALRARIVLAAADGLNNSQIARREGVDVATARLWRGRWLGLQPVGFADLGVAERLADAPRPGRQPTIGPEQQCRIVALACAAPSQSGRPLSQWTGREVAEEIVARGILPAISRRHAARLRKRGTSSPTASATG